MPKIVGSSLDRNDLGTCGSRKSKTKNRSECELWHDTVGTCPIQHLEVRNMTLQLPIQTVRQIQLYQSSSIRNLTRSWRQIARRYSLGSTKKGMQDSEMVLSVALTQAKEQSPGQSQFFKRRLNPSAIHRSGIPSNPPNKKLRSTSILPKSQPAYQISPRFGSTHP